MTDENASEHAIFLISLSGGATGEIESAILPLSEQDQKTWTKELEVNDLDECKVVSITAFNSELNMYLFLDGQTFSQLNALANELNRLRNDFGETAFDAFVCENKESRFRSADMALKAVDNIRENLAMQENRRYGMFKISIHNSEWSDEIDLPVDETEQDRILNLLDSVEDTQFKIEQCEEIPELNGVAFAETAHFSELNFLAKRVNEIGKDKVNICAYRALMSELPDNICEAINRTYGLETVPVYPCESLEDYGEFVIENEFLDELEEIPYELYDLLDREKVGALKQERDGGMFIDGYYVIPSEYDPVLAYDGVMLPDLAEDDDMKMEVEML